YLPHAHDLHHHSRVRSSMSGLVAAAPGSATQVVFSYLQTPRSRSCCRKQAVVRCEWLQSPTRTVKPTVNPHQHVGIGGDGKAVLALVEFRLAAAKHHITLFASKNVFFHGSHGASLPHSTHA